MSASTTKFAPMDSALVLILSLSSQSPTVEIVVTSVPSTKYVLLVFAHVPMLRLSELFLIVVIVVFYAQPTKFVPVDPAFVQQDSAIVRQLFQEDATFP